MTSGRKPKPQPAPPGSRLPDCPDHLDTEARAEWQRMITALKPHGLVDRMDRAALAAYCQAWSRWAEAELKIRETGPVVKSPSGYPIQNPYLAIANKAMAQMKTFLTEFGLTPTSRTRLTLARHDA